LRDGGAMLRRHGPPIMISDANYRYVVDKRNALTEWRGYKRIYSASGELVRLHKTH
jgi:hypothetical protein